MTTDTPMVELCARAIYARIPNGGYVIRGHGTAAHSNDFRPDPWEEATDRHEECRDLARAVLECLRTPTPEMVEDIWQILDGSGGFVTHDEVENAFTAAIDRALLPSKGEGE